MEVRTILIKTDPGKGTETQKSMVEQTDTGCLVVIEKRGLFQEVHILQKYGIDSVTEVSDLKQDNFNEFENQGETWFCSSLGVSIPVLLTNPQQCPCRQVRFDYVVR